METIAEERVKKKFESVMKRKTDSRREKVTFSMVRKAILTKKKESRR